MDEKVGNLYELADRLRQKLDKVNRLDGVNGEADLHYRKGWVAALEKVISWLPEEVTKND